MTLEKAMYDLLEKLRPSHQTHDCGIAIQVFDNRFAFVTSWSIHIIMICDFPGQFLTQGKCWNLAAFQTFLTYGLRVILGGGNKNKAEIPFHKE